MLRLGPKSQISRPAAEHTGDRVTPGHPIWSARIPEGPEGTETSGLAR